MKKYTPLTWTVTSWMMMFMIAPLLIIIAFSFLSKALYGGVEWQLNLQNFDRLGEWVYLKIYFRSFMLAAQTTIICFILGFPIAWVMATAQSPQTRMSLLMLILIPFWTNFVVRAYSIRFLLSPEGPLHTILGWDLNLAASKELVMIGMVLNYLPLMVIPLFVTLDKMDFNLLEASRDLGANRMQSFFQVILPLSKAGWISGLMFVFVPALGEFLIPDILGGATTLFLGNLIFDQFLKTRDWPFGAAISLVLVLSALIAFLVETRLRKEV